MCWINVIAGAPSEVQPLVAKIAVLVPSVRQEGRKVDGGQRLMFGLGKGEPR